MTHMKRLLNFFCSAWTVLLVCVSCYDDTQIWDKLNDHENRIKQLEDLCRDLNTNVSALQTLVKALQNNDYITRVVSVTEAGKEVGYTLEFSKSASVTIYHGKDGTDGKDGADGKNGTNGKTPVVGVAKHTDGVYYWTLDGAWMRDDKGNIIPTTGKDGADGKDGQDGQDGKDGTTPIIGVALDPIDNAYYWTLNGDWLLDKDGNRIPLTSRDGQNGADGKDGITPQLKIENGYWYVSTDNGKTWTQLGKAVGEAWKTWKLK